MAFPGIPLASVRLRLRAREPLRIPEGGPGAVLRGAFGTELKRLVCAFDPRTTPCGPCELRRACPYPLAFEPAPPEGGTPRRMQDPPRPFVIKPPLAAKDFYAPGETIEFDVVILGPKIDAIFPYFVAVWENLGELGIGERPRGRFELESVSGVDLSGASEPALLYDCAARRVLGGPPAIDSASIEGRAASLPSDRVRVRFLTPTELRADGRAVHQPAFQHLLKRLLTRLSALATFHGAGAPALDYRGLATRSEAVRTETLATRWIDRSRSAGHAPVRHSLAGVVGEAVYAGDLGEFLPLLALGEVVHVGKECVFGNGWIAASRPDSAGGDGR